MVKITYRLESRLGQHRVSLDARKREKSFPTPAAVGYTQQTLGKGVKLPYSRAKAGFLGELTLRIVFYIAGRIITIIAVIVIEVAVVAAEAVAEATRTATSSSRNRILQKAIVAQLLTTKFPASHGTR